MKKPMELYEIMRKIIPGKQYCISVNGEQAINAAEKVIGNHCYMPIKSNEIEYPDTYVGQLEIVLNDDTLYNGFIQKWVSLSFIPAENVIPAIIWLKNNGFEGCYACIAGELEQVASDPTNYTEYPFIIPEKRLYISDNGSLCTCKELPANKLVVFDDNGIIRKLGYMAVSWNENEQAYQTLSCDETGEYRRTENGCAIRIFSTTIIDKPVRKRKNKFIPDAKSCTVQIFPEYKTEKAYALPDGTDGTFSRHARHYYKFIAKSVCYVDEQGNIFAPVWALH